ncbi:hypothetical protein KY290_004940 [Solanum tuberosum]|uniref:Uncharacterized protein n=1 Tax=Solanum tuberosum TaxID=4113 RepID=A0ABQ7WEI2_SOLTU|nr:hypothetical protein KY290_004940 [Solanum tuberosum]
MKFSRASGLQANADKSSLYIAGVADHIKQELLKELGYTEGTMPFRYLGVPLASKKLSVNQFMPLIEKITVKVTCWSAKLLSYSGRVHLIKTFLWTRAITISKKALVAWKTVCKPQAGIETITIPTAASWVVRKILGTRDMLIQRQAGQDDLMKGFVKAQKGGKFSTKKMYTYIMPTFPRVEWKSITLQQGVTRTLWRRLCNWLGIQRSIQDWKSEIAWISDVAKKNAGAAEIKTSFFVTIVYIIWRERNMIRFQRGRLCMEKTLKEIVMHIHLRGQHKAKWKHLLHALNNYP